MIVIDIKNMLRDQRVLSVLAYSQYMPTADTLHRLADQCAADPAVSAFACEDQGAILGAIILKAAGGGAFEILHIATAPPHRGKGIASELISHAIEALQCAVLVAETDDDAVDFYRKYGFQIESLGEKYPGTIRYRCTLRLR